MFQRLHGIDYNKEVIYCLSENQILLCVLYLHLLNLAALP